MATITATKDYGLFKLYAYNRIVKKIQWLENNMRQYGWIDAYPMHVYRNGNKKLVIKDGHHRFEVAKKLDIPVKYVVCQDSATIYELQRATNIWSMQDYLDGGIKAGSEEYLRLKDFQDRTGISLQCCIEMFAGRTSISGLKEEFKEGEFIIRNETFAELVGQIVVHMKRIGVDFATNHMLVKALMKALLVDELDVSELKHKMAKHSYLFEKQASLKDYLIMIENIYNRQRKDKIPLFFLADQAAKNRKFGGLKKRK